MLPNMHCTYVFQRQILHSTNEETKIQRKRMTYPREAGKACAFPPLPAIPTLASKASCPCPTSLGIHHLQSELRSSSSDIQTHPQVSPYLQSRGPLPRVRTGVAGTLRPSKLEALLGSERVGLDRDGRPTSGPRLETGPTSRPSCQPRLRIPLLVPGKGKNRFLFTWWGWPQSYAGSSGPHKYLMVEVSMGHVARGCPQILPETGPTLLVVRGAPLEGSSYEALLCRMENRVKFNERAQRG